MARSTWIAALCAAAAAQMIGASLALGFPGRGHVFAGTFEGQGEHAIDDGDGIAVDEATGEVYVADRSSPHEQVERFRPNGQGGYEFVSAFVVKSPAGIAVDNSTSSTDPSRGDVYVIGNEEEGGDSEEHDVLYKYDPSTEKLVYKKSIFKRAGEELELEEIYGVTVDASGTLWVYWGEEGIVSGFTDEATNRWEPSLSKLELKAAERFECRARPGFAVAPHDEYFYLARERAMATEECLEEEAAPVAVEKFSESGQLIAAGLDNENTTGVAVDQTGGEVYADNAASVAAFTPSGAFIQRFGAGEISAAGALAVDSAHGEVYALEPEAGKVAVFGSEAAAAPTIDSVQAQNLTPSSERIDAEIDPSGAQTTYYVQYGTVSCTTEPASCTDVPAAPGADAGSGFGDQPVTVELTGLHPNTTYYYRVVAHNENGTAESPQAPDTFFTTLPSAQGVLADHRAWELVSPPDKHGAEVEAISREGSVIQAAVDGDAITWTASGPVTQAPEGDRAPEPVQVLSRRAPGEGWSSADVTTPHDAGEGITTGAAPEYRFFTPDLSLALVEPQVPAEPQESPPLAPGASEKTMYVRDNATAQYVPLVTPADDSAGTAFGGKLEFAGAAPNLAHVVFGSEVPLNAQAVGEGLYEWEDGAPLKLVSLLPEHEGTQAPAGEPLLGGDSGADVRNAISTDGSRVFWTNGSSDEGPLFMTDTARGETIQVNAAQGVPEATAEDIEDDLDEVRFQDASTGGSRVFFTDTWPLTPESNLEPRAGEASNPADLYELNVESGKLVDLTPDAQVGEKADVLGMLPGASEDGSYVYFVADGALAPGAQPGDCSRVKQTVPEPQDSCNLYLSEPDPEDPERRQTRLIAQLSMNDAADWGESVGAPPTSLGGLTSAVSGNGRYLAFMSERELTGYDNVDANPAAGGAHDEEVYLYDAAAGRLVCASCNPTGEPPHGVFDTLTGGEGLGLLVDRPETWAGRWIAGSLPGWTLSQLAGTAGPRTEYQSRYLSDSGRLFFNSADALVPAVASRTRSEEIDGASEQVGVENVYEYEPSGEGSCTSQPGCVTLVSSGTSDHESAFLDASEGGADVFFLTAAELVPEDTDNSLDIYDARICDTAESEPCLVPKAPPPEPCAGEACRPPQTAQQPSPSPLTDLASGPGNPVPKTTLAPNKKTTTPKAQTTQQKLQAALKACHKLANERKRAKCEARARRKYRVKAKKKKKSKTAKKSAVHGAGSRKTAVLGWAGEEPAVSAAGSGTTAISAQRRG